MNNLTATELQILNNLSKELNPTVSLGAKIQELINDLPGVGTALNAVNASVNLTISGVVIDGEKVVIDNPYAPGSDTYEFLADTEQSKTNPAFIAVDISSYATKASCVLTMDTKPTSGDTLTIGSKVYTFVPVGTDTADGEVSVGADLAAAKVNLVSAINGTDNVSDPHPLVSASAFAGNDCTITAFVGGTAGNAIGTIETFTAVSNVFASATLTSGTNCTATNAGTALVAAVTAHDTQDVAANKESASLVSFTADIAGVNGNEIAVSKTMANGAFANSATKLSGGVNGTVAKAGKMLVDENYVYMAIADNLSSGKNWKKAALA